MVVLTSVSNDYSLLAKSSVSTCNCWFTLDLWFVKVAPLCLWCFTLVWLHHKNYKYNLQLSSKLGYNLCCWLILVSYARPLGFTVEWHVKINFLFIYFKRCMKTKIFRPVTCFVAPFILNVVPGSLWVAQNLSHKTGTGWEYDLPVDF